MFHILISASAAWFLAAPVPVGPPYPSSLHSVRADAIWVVKITEVRWDKPEEDKIIRGRLSVALTEVLRGKKQAAGTAYQFKMWMFRRQAREFGAGAADVGSLWPYLPLKKDARLIIFLAKEREQGRPDRWIASVGEEKVIDVQPYTDALVHDLALINRCMQAKDQGAAIWQALQKPKEIGKEFASFAGEALFERYLGTADLRKKVVQFVSGNGLPAPVRRRLVRYIESYIGHDRLPKDQIQLLADLIVRDLLDPKLEKYRQPSTRALYHLLVKHKGADTVTIPKDPSRNYFGEPGA